LATVLPEHRLQQISKDDYRIEYSTSTGTLKYITLRGVSFHAMCKRDLGAIVANPL